jgi:hypothetical protein
LHASDSRTLFANGVLKTSDGGAMWTAISAGLDNPDVRTLLLQADGTLLAGTRGNELCSLESGDSSREQMPPLGNLEQPWPIWNLGLYQCASVLFPPHDPNTTCIGTFSTGNYKSVDGGRHWREKNVGFTNDGIFYITFHPDAPAIIYAGTYNGVNRSVDGGEHWHDWDNGWPDEQWVFDIAFDPRDADVIYACSLNGENQGRGVKGLHGTVMKTTDVESATTGGAGGMRKAPKRGLSVKI